MDDHLRDWDPLAAMDVTEGVDRTLRDLTVNIMRVSRGAGNAPEMARQVIECAVMLQRYRREKGHWPPAWALEKAIYFDPKGMERQRDLTGYDLQMRVAVDEMVKGGLRVAAARINRDHSQEHSGESDLVKGARRLPGVRP